MKRRIKLTDFRISEQGWNGKGKARGLFYKPLGSFNNTHICKAKHREFILRNYIEKYKENIIGNQ